jgi:hypothetical protein
MPVDSLQKQDESADGRFLNGCSGNPGSPAGLLKPGDDGRGGPAGGRGRGHEGATLVGVMESKRRAMETIELKKRLRALEAMRARA